MKILFGGGGTGGHFYPIIAVAQKINEIVEKEKLVRVELYYMSDSPYDERLLFENQISFRKTSAGKVRKYFSFKNFFDAFKTAWGVLSATLKMYSIYPDVVFGKGGYASFPALWAARFLRIPVILHESDSIPGRVNLWAGKFAKKIAVSYPEAMDYFPEEKTAVTGNPIRRELINPSEPNAFGYFGLDSSIPTIFIIGGSQGAMNINDTVIDLLPELVKKFQIVHQTGVNNFKEVSARAGFVLENNPNKSRYKPLPFMDELDLRSMASCASLIITRAGSSIFEIAHWGLPSIVIPISEDVSRDQTKNAFAYARRSGATVIEEKNMSGAILLSEINRILENPKVAEEMRGGAKSFSSEDASELIAREILNIALEHEK